jgi:TPR repeat protein
MQRLIVPVILLCCHVLALGADIAPPPLEQLFESGRYSEFLDAAKPLAEKGDAGAQFLLGKAYHLGKGVETDTERALALYSLAAGQNNARAENNLGLMVMEQRQDQRAALVHFKRALELGLKEPAVRNARIARMTLCEAERDEEMCIAAGEDYVQAWQTEHNNEMLDRAVSAYATACSSVRYLNKFTTGSRMTAEPVPVCARALDLAETGARLGLARSTHNRGALDHEAGGYDEAIKWFKRAYERGFGLSAYVIGTMHEKGQGVPQNDAEALGWFKRAAELKEARALERLVSHWQVQIKSTFDRDIIDNALNELNKLQADGVESEHGRRRLAVIKTVEANAAQFPLFSKRPIRANFCPRDSGFHGYTIWRLFAVPQAGYLEELASELPLLASGTADAQGCVKFDAPALKKIRKALARGETLLFNWPGRRTVLALNRDAGGQAKFSVGMSVDGLPD